MEREEVTDSVGYKVTKVALEWYENNQDLDAIDAFEAGWDAAIKGLHTSKGYPIDLNGNIKSYDEALKDVEIFNKKMREKLVEKIIEYLYIKCSEGEIEVRNMESLIADLKIKMEE